MPAAQDQTGRVTPRLWRLRRLVPAPSTEEQTPSARVRRALGMVVLAAWFGLAAGLLETALVYLHVQWVDAQTHRSLQMGHDAVWMVSAANLLVFSAGGLLAGLAVLLPAKWPSRVAFVALAFLACYEVLLSVRELARHTQLLLAGGLAMTLARRVRWDQPRFRRLVYFSLPCLITVLGGSIVALTVSERRREQSALAGLPAPAERAPNVLFLVLDTVRAQSLGLYGHDRPTSPHLDRLSRRGITFEQARSPGVWTLPSHASMFTGRWPHELSARLQRPLDGTHPTLAEFLAGQGYATAGFVANTLFCNTWFGLARGFAHYEDVEFSVQTLLRYSELGRRLVRLVGNPLDERTDAFFFRKSAATINRDLLGWLDARTSADRPFFVFLNYFDAHDPYVPPGGFRHGFLTERLSAADRATMQRWHDLDPRQRTPRAIAIARNAYEECIAALDAELGRLFDALEQRGILEKTLVVITADHGEEFGEHGGFGHGNLFSEVTRVPLIIIPPGGLAHPVRVAEPVSLRDLPSTIAECVGANHAAPFPGRSLARFWNADAVTGGAPEDSVVVSEIVDRQRNDPPNWLYARSLIAEGHAYLRNASGVEQLFDLRADADQKRDLVPDLPPAAAILERFRERLGRIGPAGEAH